MMLPKTVLYLQILIFTLFLFDFVSCHFQNSTIFVNQENKYGGEIEIPYQAQLIQPGDDHYFCGAAIISRTKLLTAASCIQDTITLYQVLVGSITYRKGQVHTVANVKIHPEFQPGSFENDIALVLLNHPLTFDKNIMRIQLSTKDVMGGSRNIYHGFGLTYLNSLSTFKTFELIPADLNICERFFKGKSCYNCPKNSCNSCQAHSGELLVKGRKLVGIVSRPSVCVDPEAPIIFTRIANILDFIHENLRDAKKG